MRTGIVLLLLLLLATRSPGQTTQPQADSEGTDAALKAAKSLERLYQSIGDEVLACVVQVLPSFGDRRGNESDTAESDDPLGAFEHFFGPDASPRNRRTGSGFVIDKRGFIVTSAHVVSGATAVFVRLHDDVVLEAAVVGTNEGSDLAVLRIPPDRAPALQWGDSAKLRRGSIVLAMGSPFGLRNSVSQGIVSGLGRRGPIGNRQAVFIQTDAAINPGNSGGPLVNLDGEVVGINAWIITPTRGIGGVGFAVPSNLARVVVAGMVNELLGAVAPAKSSALAWLGVIPAREASGGRDVLLYHVLAGTPAARAGLRPGDRLRTVNGKRVDATVVLQAVVENLRPGQTLTIELAGHAEPVTLTTGRRPVTFDPAWRVDGALQPVEESPLSKIQRRTLRQALIERDCPCGCGRALYDCFGCSAAKSEFSEAENLVRLGLSAAQTSHRLDPPVLALVWADYTDPHGRELLRTLDRLKPRYGSLLRVRRRYFPVNPNDLGGWRRTINAIEMARSAGHYESAHRLLLDENGMDWQQKLAIMPEVLDLDSKDFEQGLAESRYEQQIQKDLTAAPTQFQVGRSPSLRVNGIVFEEGLGIKKLTEHIERAILETAF